MESRQIKFRGIGKDGTMRVGHYKSIVGQCCIRQRTIDGFEDKPIIFDQHYILVPQLPSETGWRLNEAYIEYQVDKRTVGQFSGLFDDNSVEIYEGDVVEFPEYYETPEMTNTNFIKGLVCFEHGAFQLRVNNEKLTVDTYTLAHEMDSYDGRFTVIGNIHQNPELL